MEINHYKGHDEKDSLSKENSSSKLKMLVHCAVIRNIVQPQNSSFLLKGLFFLMFHGHNRIPKYMTNADEIYARHCLELAHKSSLETMLNSEKTLHMAKFIGGDHQCSSHEFGGSEKNNNLNNLICYDSIESSSGFGVSSPYQLEMKPPMVPNHNLNSCFSFGFGVSLGLTKGMFQCSWNQSIPHFVFCADKNEIYVAKLSEIEPKDDESLDYVYLIYLTKGSKKGNKIFDSDLQQLVGKLNVSTIFTLCSDNYIMMETHFVLFGDLQIHDKEMHTSKKKNGFSKKVVKVLRTSPFSKQGTLSKEFELHSYGPSEINLLGKNVPTNFEVAAIVVKEHVPFNCLEKVGGWGSKFLNKLPSECYGGKNEDYSNSMSIVIPDGIHGGPKTRDGGPSSLIDRWKSGGCCDCGGWDEGCPLTLFQRRQSEDVDGDCKTLDIVSQDSRNFSSTLKMMSINDGLYYVHFEHPFSALQSFSIAMANIHSQSPSLQPNFAAQKL